MITEIVDITAIDNGRAIRFNVITDAQGAHERVSVTVGSQQFTTFVQGGPGVVAGLSISLTGQGQFFAPEPYEVVLIAESSHITSTPTVLQLGFKEPSPKHKPPPV